MDAILKLYLKLSALCISGFMLIIFLLTLDGKDMILRTYFWEISVGGGMIFAGLVTIVHLQRLRAAGIRVINDETISTHQKRVLSAQIDRDKLLEKLKADPRFKHAHVIKTTDRIQLKTGFVGHSWGELVDIKFEANNRIRVLCRPRYIFSILDGARSFEFAELVVQLIRETENRGLSGSIYNPN